MIHWVDVLFYGACVVGFAYALGRLHGLREANRIHQKYNQPEKAMGEGIGGA